MRTIAAFTQASDRRPQSLVIERHNKQLEGPERIYRFLAGHFPVPSDLADFVYLAQLNQAEGLKRGVEHWRTNMYRTAGALFWQFNDCWPVVSWSVMGMPSASGPSATAPILSRLTWKPGTFPSEARKSLPGHRRSKSRTEPGRRRRFCAGTFALKKNYSRRALSKPGNHPSDSPLRRA